MEAEGTFDYELDFKFKKTRTISFRQQFERKFKITKYGRSQS
jgi:hypothetical protein